MIAARIAALNNLLRSHDADSQAIRARPTSQSGPMPDGRDVWKEKALYQAHSTGKNLLCSALPGESHDGRMGGNQGL